MMLHAVRTYKSAEPLAREDQLAWKLAAVATDPVAIDADVA
ncbi:MAG: 2-methylcitrate dehydratase, partial [Sphingomonas bacterium]|nr:2-methylcitrate dehydratase [Sphingomonas bacterium]